MGNSLEQLAAEDGSIWKIARSLVKTGKMTIPPPQHGDRNITCPEEKLHILADMLEEQFTPNEVPPSQRDKVNRIAYR